MSEFMSLGAKPQPRTQEQRRQATTTALMAAAIEVLFEKGYSALTMAQVAERAGVSRGALNHYYPTKEQLVIAAAHHAMEVEMEHIDDDVLNSMTLEDTVEAFLDGSQEFFLSRSFIAQLELVLAARNDPRIGDVYYPLIEQYRSLYDSTWQEALMRAGMDADEASQLIDMTNLTLRGLALSVHREPDSASAAAQLTLARKKLRQLSNT